MPERITDAVAGDPRVGVPVVLADEFAAVLVAEVQRDDVSGQLEAAIFKRANLAGGSLEDADDLARDCGRARCLGARFPGTACGAAP
ncbi:MAG: hypothetical protein ABWY12_15255 [Burkholderiales bacterium]